MTSIKHPDSSQKNMRSIYVECETCGHCVDFQSPTEGQPVAITKAQYYVADTVQKWIKEAKEAKDTIAKAHTFIQ